MLDHRSELLRIRSEAVQGAEELLVAAGFERAYPYRQLTGRTRARDASAPRRD